MSTLLLPHRHRASPQHSPPTVAPPCRLHRLHRPYRQHRQQGSPVTGRPGAEVHHCPAGVSAYAALIVLTVLTVLTVLAWFSAAELILITRVPALPSRPKVISTPNLRRNVCARRSRPARARGVLGHPFVSFQTPSPPNSAPARRRSEALPVHVLRFAINSRIRAATGSPSMSSSMAALRFAWYARANVPAGQNAVSQAVAHSAKSAIRGSCAS